MTTDWSEIDNRVADHAWYASDEYRQVFKRLRDEDPVHWVDGTDYGHSFWLITRYADVKELLFEPTKLSNRMSNRLPRGPSAPPGGEERDRLRHQHLLDRRSDAQRLPASGQQALQHPGDRPHAGRHRGIRR
jgi:cytochrome P450